MCNNNTSKYLLIVSYVPGTITDSFSSINIFILQHLLEPDSIIIYIRKNFYKLVKTLYQW